MFGARWSSTVPLLGVAIGYVGVHVSFVVLLGLCALLHGLLILGADVDDADDTDTLGEGCNLLLVGTRYRDIHLVRFVAPILKLPLVWLKIPIYCIVFPALIGVYVCAGPPRLVHIQ